MLGPKETEAARGKRRPRRPGEKQPFFFPLLALSPWPPSSLSLSLSPLFPLELEPLSPGGASFPPATSAAKAIAVLLAGVVVSIRRLEDDEVGTNARGEKKTRALLLTEAAAAEPAAVVLVPVPSPCRSSPEKPVVAVVVVGRRRMTIDAKDAKVAQPAANLAREGQRDRK